MKLLLSQDKSSVLVTGCSDKEWIRMSKFPGTIPEGGHFFFPADVRVAYNLISRLKNKFKNVEWTEEVEKLYNADFKLLELPSDFVFFTEPKPFQRIALRFAHTVGGGGLLLEPGMGKTKIVLDFIALRKFTRSLIVCPKPLLFVWQDERAIHRPDKTIYIVETTNWDKEKEGIMSADVTVLNYSKACIFKEQLAQIRFDFIGLDEALIKDPSTNRTKDMTWLGRRIPHRMLMSGTLVNNSPLDVFAPVRFLEPSLTSWSFTKFKDEYAVQVPGKNHGKFVVGFRKVPEIKSILESVSIVMTKEEWLKLPNKTFEADYIQLSDEQRQAYNDLQSNYIATIGGDTLEIDNPLVALTKLIQISNGFVYLDNKDNIDELQAKPTKTKKRKVYYFPVQPKLEHLIRLLKGRLKTKRCMIWFNMDGEYELISKRLEKEGITYLSIRGGDKAIGDKVRLFNSSPGIQALVCQARSVNYGITVLGQDYEEAELENVPDVTPEVFTQIFYSLNFSLEVFLQQQDRIHRLGQTHECLYILIIGNSDAERRVMDAITDKQDIRGQVLQDVIKMLGLER